jgi:hypothetical protein
MQTAGTLVQIHVVGNNGSAPNKVSGLGIAQVQLQNQITVC